VKAATKRIPVNDAMLSTPPRLSYSAGSNDALLMAQARVGLQTKVQAFADFPADLGG
jgi:hypothetical protein